MDLAAAGINLAHSFGESGVDIEIFLFGVACLILAIVFFFQKNVKRQVPPFLVLIAGLFMAAAVVAGGEETPETVARPEGLAVNVVSPAEGDEVPAGEEISIEVEIEGGSLVTETSSDDPTAGHLHIFVDGALFSMPTTDKPTVELEPGTRELTVEFTKADHASFEPRVLDRVEVEAR